MSQPFYDYEHPQSHSLSQLPELTLLPAGKPISADYFVKLGNRHYTSFLTRALQRDLDLAIDHYRQAMDINPSLPEAYVRLAAALLDKGEFTLDNAIQYGRIALQLDPHYAEGHLFLGYFLRRGGHLEEALAQFEHAIAKTAAHRQAPAKAHMALGRTLLQKASVSYELSSVARIRLTLKGLQHVGWGCCLLPADSQAFQMLKGALLSDAQIYTLTQLGRTLKTLGLREQTAQVYEWASRNMPQEPLFFHLLGDLHGEGQNLDGAIYFYNRAQELDPDNPLLHKKLGRAYYQCHDGANAAKSLEKVLDSELADFDTLYTLVQISIDRQEYMRALYYSKELLKEAPKNPYIHSNMAYVLFKLEDYDGAIQEYKHAITHGEDALWTATVAQTLGTIQYQIKQDPEAAVSMFQLAYQLDPSNLEALSMLGDIYTEQGNFESAIQAYRHILSVEPDNADCHNYLGYLLWQLDKNDEAIAAYQKAIALNQDNPIAYNNLGVIYLDEKCQPQQALDLFEQATLLKPDYTLARFNVGRSLEALGKVADAAQNYTDALTLNGHNAELDNDEILDRLEQLFQA